MGVVPPDGRDEGIGGAYSPMATSPTTTGFLDNVTAGFKAAKAGPASTRNRQAIYEAGLYDQVISALDAEGERGADKLPVRPGGFGYTGPKNIPVNQFGVGFVDVPRRFYNPYSGKPGLIDESSSPVQRFYLGGDRTEMGAIWAAVQRVRQRKPDFLKEFPDQASLERAANMRRRAEQAEAADVMDRAGRAGTVGGFLGGMAGSIVAGDPENFIAFGGGTAGRVTAGMVLKRSLVGATENVVAGGLALPGQVVDAERLGQEMTPEDMKHQIEEQAAIGALFAVSAATAPGALSKAKQVAGKAVDVAIDAAPSPIKTALMAASVRSGTVKDRALLGEFRRLRDPYGAYSTATPDERAAANVTEHNVEVRESSPLPTDGDSEHERRLDAFAASLGVDLPAPHVEPPAPVQTPTVRDRAEGGRRPASFAEAVHQAEGTGKNPNSSATGHFQFIDSTWMEYAPRVTDTSGMSRAQILALRNDRGIATRAEQLFRADNGRYLRSHGIEDSAGNLSLAHFLGKRDAARVLKADPSTSVASLIDGASFRANRSVFDKHSTAGDLIAWAHRRIGATVDSIPARPDSVPSAGEYAEMQPSYEARLAPDEVQTDAETYQYKSGGDESGVTDKLRTVDAWNRVMSGDIIVHERLDGQKYVVDGHQRTGLAKRLYADDPSIQLPALVFKEADGFTPQMMRVLGALRNIVAGTGTLVDNARVLRDAPDGAALIKGAEHRRAIEGLANLSHETFGAVVNEVIPPEIAATIGNVARDEPDTHMALADLLIRNRIGNPREAEAIVRQARADGFGRPDAEQMSMFGDMPTESLYIPIARILAGATKRLREEKRTFKTLAERAGRIEEAGNVLDRTANERRLGGAEEAIAILNAVAHRSGPVRDALIAAARAELSGAKRGAAIGRFLDDLDQIDLLAAARGVEQDGGAGAALGREGSGGAAEATDGELPDSLEPSLFEQAVATEARASAFSEPVGTAAREQTALLEHDLKMEAVVLENDTRGKGIFYHGARGEVPQLTEGYYNPANIYGGIDTFYTTDATDIAQGYGRRHASARIYQIEEVAPVNFFDMEAKRPPSEWNNLLGIKDDDFGLVPMALDEAGESPNLREIMDEIRDYSAGEGYSRDEVQEIFDTVIYHLGERGFGGMTHTGGLKTGRKPHTVRIYFDAPNQIKLHDVTPAEGLGRGQTEGSPRDRAPSDRAEREGSTGIAQEGGGGPEGNVENLARYEFAVGDTEAEVDRKASLLNYIIDEGGPKADAASRVKDRLFAEFDAASSGLGTGLFDVPETGFRLANDEDARPKTIAEIMAEPEADEAAAAAARDCLK